MTEDEANKKWCPQTLLAFQDREGEFQPQGACCIGSECMAWRWQVTPKLYEDLAYDPENGIRLAGGPTGYCGFAGRPA